MEEIEEVALWVEANPHETSFVDIQALATTYARTSPDDAMAWAMRLPLEDSLEAAPAVVNAMADMDVGKAADLVLGIHDAALLASTSRALVKSWAMVDPSSATRWLWNHPHVVETHDVNLPYGDSLYHLLFHHWAKEDLHSASGFLVEIVDDVARWAATGGVIDAMDLGTRRNIPLLESLYEGLPESRRPDYAAWMLHQHHRSQDPEAAKRFYKAYERYMGYEQGG